MSQRSFARVSRDTHEEYLCNTCLRVLDVASDPMSPNAGGDCWGCVGKTEADQGWQLFVNFVQDEINKGWRFADGSPKPPPED